MIARIVILLGVVWSTAAAQTTSVWHVRDSGVTTTLSSIAVRSLFESSGRKDRVVAVGDEGTIIYSDNEGLTWATSPSGTNAGLNAAFYDATTARYYAVGEGGTILGSGDGLAWARETSPVTTRLKEVRRDSGLGLIAIGESPAELLVRDAAGVWSRSDAQIESLGPPADLLPGVAWKATGTGVSSFQTGVVTVAVGAAGSIARRHGEGWTNAPSGTTEDLRAVCFKTGGGTSLVTRTLTVWVGEFFVVGTNGTILRSGDGSTWKRDRAPTSRTLNAVASTDRMVIAVGEAGAVLRTGGVTEIPMFTQQTVRVGSAAGGPYLEAAVEGAGAMSFLWVRRTAGAPVPVGSDFPRQVLTTEPTAEHQLLVGNAFGLVQSEQPVASRFLNLSARANVGTGENILIGGFSLRGPTRDRERQFLIRAVGPGLRAQGVTQPLEKPVLTLFRGQTAIAANSGWESALNAGEVAAAAQRIQTFPLAPGASDSALLVSLSEGNYTAHIENGGGNGGIALLEIYDVDSPNLEHLVNVSARARVQPGEGVLIGGLVLEGGRQKSVLLRAGGPALNAQGIQASLPRPLLTLYRGQTPVAQRASWSGELDAPALRTAAIATGAFAFSEGSADAALLTELEPGAHTIVVGDRDGASGVALVEIYEHP